MAIRGYIKSLIARGYSLATSSLSVLVPTVIVYIIATIDLGFKSTPIDISAYPIDYILDTLSAAGVTIRGSILFILAAASIKIVSIYYVSEDIYRLRLGQGASRYTRLITDPGLLYFVKFYSFYAAWNLAFFIMGLSIVYFSSVLNPIASWVVSVLSFIFLFPVYYGGTSITAFIFSGRRVGARFEGLKLRLINNASKIYIFYLVRSVIDLCSMLGVPVLIYLLTDGSVLYFPLTVIALAPIILFIRTTSQYFKLDIFQPNESQLN